MSDRALSRLSVHNHTIAVAVAYQTISRIDLLHFERYSARDLTEHRVIEPLDDRLGSRQSRVVHRGPGSLRQVIARPNAVELTRG